MAPAREENHWRRIVEDCFRREAGPEAAIPDFSQDLMETGVLDSMAWVSFLRALESASGFSDLGAGLRERTPSLESILQVFNETRMRTRLTTKSASSAHGADSSAHARSASALVLLASASAVAG